MIVQANTKTLASIVLAALIGVFALLFMAAQRRSSAPAGVLARKAADAVGYWTLNRVPGSQRIVDLVLSDSSVEDALAEPEEPSAWFKLTRWIGELFTGSQEAKPSSSIALAMERQTQALTWTFDGYSKTEEPKVIAEVMESLRKTHDAGAEVNIVAQGLLAAATLKALKNLEGEARGGRELKVNRFVMLGVDKQRLTKMDPVFFSNPQQPANVRAWVAVVPHASAGPPAKAIAIGKQAYGMRSEGSLTVLIAPQDGSFGAAAQDGAKVVAVALGASPGPAVDAGTPEEPQGGSGIFPPKRPTRTFRNLEGKMIEKPVEGAGGSSLGFVKGEAGMSAAGGGGGGDYWSVNQCSTEERTYDTCKMERKSCLSEHCEGVGVNDDYSLLSDGAYLRCVTASGCKKDCDDVMKIYQDCMAKAKGKSAADDSVSSGGGKSAAEASGQRKEKPSETCKGIEKFSGRKNLQLAYNSKQYQDCIAGRNQCRLKNKKSDCPECHLCGK